MDRLKGTELLERLGGRIFLSTYEAWQALTGRAAVAA